MKFTFAFVAVSISLACLTSVCHGSSWFKKAKKKFETNTFKEVELIQNVSNAQTEQNSPRQKLPYTQYDDRLYVESIYNMVNKPKIKNKKVYNGGCI